MHNASFASHIESPCCSRSRGQRIAHGIVWGTMIVAAGVLFLLEHLGQLGGYHAWSFWPAILVVAGVEAMTRRYRRLFGLALTLTGGLLLVHTLALAPLEWGLIWPILVIGLGVILIVKVFTRRRRMPVPPFSRDLPPGAVIMGSKEDRVDSQQYSGSEVSTVMGSYVLDLTRAEMQGDSATVVAKAVMGAIEIRVPTHWKVQVKTNPVMGAVENKTREPVDAAKTLLVQAEVVLGGIEIRN